MRVLLPVTTVLHGVGQGSTSDSRRCALVHQVILSKNSREFKLSYLLLIYKCSFCLKHCIFLAASRFPADCHSEHVALCKLYIESCFPRMQGDWNFSELSSITKVWLNSKGQEILFVPYSLLWICPCVLWKSHDRCPPWWGVLLGVMVGLCAWRLWIVDVGWCEEPPTRHPQV